MSRNYLLDKHGDLVNTQLAAVGFNLKKMLQRLKAEALNILPNLFGEFWTQFGIQNMHFEI